MRTRKMRTPKKMIAKKISKIIIKNKIKLSLNNYNLTTQCNFPYFPLECPSSQLLAHGRLKKKNSSFDGKTNTSQVNPVIMAPFLRE